MDVQGMLDGSVQHRAAKVEDIDGHEMLVRAVPYSEHFTDIGGGIEERFLPKAFARTTANRLVVHHDHGGPLVGRGVEFRDEADGPYIRAKIGSTPAAEEMLTLLDDGILTDVSIEFRAMKEWMTVERTGERVRVTHKRAHLTGFAVVPEGAYGEQALVLAHRDAQRERDIEAARAWLTEYRGRWR